MKTQRNLADSLPSSIIQKEKQRRHAQGRKATDEPAGRLLFNLLDGLAVDLRAPWRRR